MFAIIMNICLKWLCTMALCAWHDAAWHYDAWHYGVSHYGCYNVTWHYSAWSLKLWCFTLWGLALWCLALWCLALWCLALWCLALWCLALGAWHCGAWHYGEKIKVVNTLVLGIMCLVGILVRKLINRNCRNFNWYICLMWWSGIYHKLFTLPIILQLNKLACFLHCQTPTHSYFTL